VAGSFVGDQVLNTLTKRSFQNAILKSPAKKAIQKGILRGEIGEGKAFQGFGPFKRE